MIDMGDHGWKHPGLEGVTYGTEQSARDDAKSGDLDPDEVFEVDTRPNVVEVKNLLAESEGHVWEEYFSVTYDPGMRWPDGRICVFVVTGGCEGLYLHVEVKDGDKCKCIILGKTLRTNADKWYECWLSAGRIARMLGA